MQKTVGEWVYHSPLGSLKIKEVGALSKPWTAMCRANMHSAVLGKLIGTGGSRHWALGGSNHVADPERN